MEKTGIANLEKPHHIIIFLFVVQLISMASMEMSGPFWPIYLRELTDSDTLFSTASVAVYVAPMIGLILTGAFWGRVGDKYGHRLMMIRALGGLSLTQLAICFSSDIISIVTLRFIQGACAGYIAPAQAYGVSVSDAKKRTRLFVMLQVSTNVGSLSGGIFGGVILDIAPFYWINAVAAILCALCAVAVFIMLPNKRPKQVIVTGDPKNIAPAEKPISLSSLVPLYLVLGGLLLSRMIPQTVFSRYVSTVFEVSHTTTGIAYGALALGFIISAPLWARIFENDSLRGTLAKLLLIVLGCGVVVIFAAITRNVDVFIGLYVVWGILLGGTQPIVVATISRIANRTNQGVVLGVSQSVSQFSSISGITLGAMFGQMYGLEKIYFFVFSAYLLTSIFIGFTARYLPKRLAFISDDRFN